MAVAASAAKASLQCSIVLQPSGVSTTSCRKTFVSPVPSCGKQSSVWLQTSQCTLPLLSSSFSGRQLASSPRAVATRATGSSPQGIRSMAEPDAQTTGTSADVWIGRLAMLAFTAILSTEIVSGKGIFTLAGLETPSPGLAIAVAIVLGGGAAFSILRSLFK